jgi:hypothetical protein
MIKTIRFCVDDLAFIESINAESAPELAPLIEHLKDVAKELVADDDIDLELSDELIELVVLAETELQKIDSGILNHIAIQFHHDC